MLEVYQAVEEEVSNSLISGKFPFIVAGDHCSAGGSIAGIKKAFPDKRLGVLWVDAHADLHTPYTTPSGNMHGMPLATALGLDNKECQRNEVDENTVKMWNHLKSGAIQAEDLVFVAVRDTEEEEDALISRHNIRNYKVDEVRELGVVGLVDKLRNHFANCDMLYISFDVDSMDPELTSHGTGTPVPHGLTPEEAKELLTACVQFSNTIAFELVEVNPCLDEKQNKMAEVAFEIIEELVATIENK
jgi:arginase